MEAGSTQRNASALPRSDARFKTITDTVKRTAVRCSWACVRRSAEAWATEGSQLGHRAGEVGADELMAARIPRRFQAQATRASRRGGVSGGRSPATIA